MNRRGFLAGILAAGMAPAVVRAASLMKVVSPAGLVAPAFDYSFDDDFTFRFLRPAMEELARKIDAEIALRPFVLGTRILSRQEFCWNIPASPLMWNSGYDQSLACWVLVMVPAQSRIGVAPERADRAR